MLKKLMINFASCHFLASHREEYVGWSSEGGMYALPGLALVLTAVGFLFGCAWCYGHKDCKVSL